MHYAALYFRRVIEQRMRATAAESDRVWGGTVNSTAVASFLGYYNQVLFAIKELFLSADDDASIALELVDDVDLSDGQGEVLFQLKTSLSDNDQFLSIADVGLWKTLRTWLEPEGDGFALEYQLVTRASVKADCSLRVLCEPESERSVDRRSALLRELAVEAQRVVDAVATGEIKANNKRVAGCRAALERPEKLAQILDRMRIRDAHRPVEYFAEDLRTCLGMAPVEYRDELVKGLVEWWVLRVLESMVGRKPRRISKRELVEFYADRLTELFSRRHLPDSFGTREPPHQDDLDAPSMMRKQIALVNGGTGRTRLASTAWWRARQQRQEWLDRGCFVDLDNFDRQLKSAWNDRFAPMCDDCADDHDRKMGMGRELLDWTSQRAPFEVPKLVETWQAPYLVQGSYQELADKLVVGWHADYETLLKMSDDEGEP